MCKLTTNPDYIRVLKRPLALVGIFCLLSPGFSISAAKDKDIPQGNQTRTDHNRTNQAPNPQRAAYGEEAKDTSGTKHRVLASGPDHLNSGVKLHEGLKPFPSSSTEERKTSSLPPVHDRSNVSDYEVDKEAKEPGRPLDPPEAETEQAPELKDELKEKEPQHAETDKESEESGDSSDSLKEAVEQAGEQADQLMGKTFSPIERAEEAIRRAKEMIGRINQMGDKLKGNIERKRGEILPLEKRAHDLGEEISRLKTENMHLGKKRAELKDAEEELKRAMARMIGGIWESLKWKNEEHGYSENKPIQQGGKHVLAAPQDHPQEDRQNREPDGRQDDPPRGNGKGGNGKGNMETEGQPIGLATKRTLSLASSPRTEGQKTEGQPTKLTTKQSPSPAVLSQTGGQKTQGQLTGLTTGQAASPISLSPIGEQPTKDQQGIAQQLSTSNPFIGGPGRHQDPISDRFPSTKVTTLPEPQSDAQSTTSSKAEDDLSPSTATHYPTTIATLLSASLVGIGALFHTTKRRRRRIQHGSGSKR